MYIRSGVLFEKYIFVKKIHIKYIIKYNISNIYKIWNVKWNKIINIKNIIFDKNSHYDFTNIDLNQFISKSFIETIILNSFSWILLKPTRLI